MKKLKIGIVIPTYNESKNIVVLVNDILSLNLNARIIIVDDNSPDGTGKIADDFAKKYTNSIFVVHRENKLGLGSAHLEGYKQAMNIDCDLIIGASRLCLKNREIPVVYHERTYGRTNIKRWKHGFLLLRMVIFAGRKLKFI